MVTSAAEAWQRAQHYAWGKWERKMMARITAAANVGDTVAKITFASIRLGANDTSARKLIVSKLEALGFSVAVEDASLAAGTRFVVNFAPPVQATDECDLK